MTTLGGHALYDLRFSLDPTSGNFTTYRTRGDTHLRISAYASYFPSMDQRIDVENAIVLSKPHWRLDGRAVPFETLQIEILLTGKLRHRFLGHRFLFTWRIR